MADEQKDQPRTGNQQKASEKPEQQSGESNYAHLDRGEEGDRQDKPEAEDDQAPDRKKPSGA